MCVHVLRLSTCVYVCVKRACVYVFYEFVYACIGATVVLY